jgi:phosphoribosylaminoimidazole-succinocarboxamide synthase
MNTVILETQIAGLTPKRGKVRDIYDLGDKLLIVATDRLSAFDVIMKSGIPCKGVVLTQISLFWLDFFGAGVDNHLITTDCAEYPDPFSRASKQLTGRSMLVKKTKVLPVECVVRGYLAGSGWKEYQASGTVCGHKLPAGIKQCGKLPEPLFTPSTKAELGTHDENIDFATAAKNIGQKNAEFIRDKSIKLFRKASAYAESRGIILADTKFEFGVMGDKIILIDEVLTPDSSRFWPADKYAPGRDQESFDKQFVRNYLEEINFDKSGLGVELPSDIIENTAGKYIEAYERLTGKPFPFKQGILPS